MTSDRLATDNAYAMLAFAAMAAQADGLEVFAADHVLLGIIRHQESSVASRVLEALGAPLEQLRARFAAAPMAAGPVTATLDENFYEMVRDEARALARNQLGSESLLLAIVRQPWTNAGQYLTKLGIDHDSALRAVMAEFGAVPLPDELRSSTEPSSTQSLVLSREASRRVDQLAVERYGMTGLVLMENAGRGVAEKLIALGIAGPVVICCGPGNNGGDGFVIARHLEAKGFAVEVLVWAEAEQLRGDAAANYEILRRAGTPLRHLTSADGLADLLDRLSPAWIVDALLGTGSRGEPRSPLDEVIEILNSSERQILAIDIPSGLDCDTGEPSAQTIRAAHTCTFVATKPGFQRPEAQQCLGKVHVLDIGIPRKLLTELREL